MAENTNLIRAPQCADIACEVLLVILLPPSTWVNEFIEVVKPASFMCHFM